MSATMMSAQRTSLLRGAAPAGLSSRVHLAPCSLVVAANRASNTAQGRRSLAVVARGVRDRTRQASKSVQRGLDRVRDEVPDAQGGTPYAALSTAFAGLAAVFAAAPGSAAYQIFTNAAAVDDVSGSPVFRILACGLLSAAAAAWTLKTEAEEGNLDGPLAQRLNLALTYFAGANLGLQSLAIGAGLLTTPATIGLGGAMAATLLVAGKNYTKATGTANPTVAAKGVASSLGNLLNFRGYNVINRGILALLTANFVAAGAGYLFLPTQTLQAVFGSTGNDEVGFLWQLVGGGLLTVVPAISYSLKEAADDNDLAAVPNRILSAGLAGAGLGHIVALYPLFTSGQYGPLLPVLLGVWGTALVAGGINVAAGDKDF